MMKCIIVDDEPLAVQILEGYVHRNGMLQLVKKCSNALEAFEIIYLLKIDLIFLDIKMPFLNGMDFMKSLQEPPAVVFTTAYSEFAVSSYEMDAVDYLLKPVTFERFSISVSRFLKVREQVEPGPIYSYFKVNGKLVKIQHADIVYAQSIRDYIIIKTLNGNFITHLTMKSLVELLPVKYFRRVHRSFLIGRLHITSIGRNEIELGEIKIPVGENYRMDVNDGNELHIG